MPGAPQEPPRAPRRGALAGRRGGRRLFTTFPHDGRAGTIEEAILAHDGQGRAARDRFTALPAEEQAALMAFRTL